MRYTTEDHGALAVTDEMVRRLVDEDRDLQMRHGADLAQGEAHELVHLGVDFGGQAGSMKDDEKVLAPVPDGESVDPPGMAEATDEAQVPDAVGAAGYDDETDLAQPVHRPEVEYTPFASEVVDPDPGAAYDIDRDTAP